MAFPHQKHSVESSANLTVRFGGASQIDAEALTAALGGIVEIAKILASETTPESHAKVIIKPPKAGSFEIALSMIVFYAPQLFTKDNYHAAKTVYEILKDIFEIKKHLSGEKPKEVSDGGNGQSVVVNQSGERKNVSKVSVKQFFQNAKLDNCIVQIFTGLERDQERKDFDIESEYGPVKIKRGEYSNMAKPVVDEESLDTDKMSQTVNVQLLIKKPDLLGNSRWGFVFDKNIEAEIEDKEFLEKVHKGEVKLSAGDKIPCRMRIDVALDEQKNPIPPPVYTVLQVTGEIISPDEDRDILIPDGAN